MRFRIDARAGGRATTGTGLTSLSATLRRELTTVADRSKASGMQAYMRSTMPFLGIAAPSVRKVTRRFRDGLEFDDARDWARSVRTLWELARFREERYAVIDLTAAQSARRFQTPAAVALYGHLIEDGAWWDYVDELAVRRVGPILRAYPGPVGQAMRRWSRGPDLWRRRSSIICQVGSKRETDVELLASCIAPSLDSKEFFLRKGIGWALRQYARDNPDWVRAYVAEHADRLSPLSRREAMKHLTSDPNQSSVPPRSAPRPRNRPPR